MRISNSTTAVSIKAADRVKCSGVFMSECGVVGIELEDSVRSSYNLLLFSEHHWRDRDKTAKH